MFHFIFVFTVCSLVQLIIKATETAKGSSYGHHIENKDIERKRSDGNGLHTGNAMNTVQNTANSVAKMKDS